MDKVEEICKEIERRLNNYWDISLHDYQTFSQDPNVRELKELLGFARNLK